MPLALEIVACAVTTMLELRVSPAQGRVKPVVKDIEDVIVLLKPEHIKGFACKKGHVHLTTPNTCRVGASA